MDGRSYPRVATLRTAASFRAATASAGADLPLDDAVEIGPDAPLARPIEVQLGPGAGVRTVGNRFAILPMEGWDAEPDGRASELVARRWARFGRSGAKLIWGGEAAAVRPDGRANPRQLVVSPATIGSIAGLRETLVDAHREHHGRVDDLVVGLQLTHSGRYARPSPGGRLEPRIAYRHPILDARLRPDEPPTLLDDADLDRLVADFVAAAVLARSAGFDFVDIKHCHGYLGHELLSAVDRPGKYGGPLANRARFLREVVAGVVAEAPGLGIGVRLGIFDFVPFRPGPDGRGEPVPTGPGGYRHGFGSDDATGLSVDLAEPSALLTLIEAMGFSLVCATAGNPYANPHLTRPAAFPPSDGYLPPEDPLVGVARQVGATARLKAAHPGITLVGSGYSYLQEWLPNVAQRAVRDGGADLVGLGRMVLSYPELPADVLAGRPLARKSLCRTFSDCTTGPRIGLISGCFPLDPYYKARPEREAIAAVRRGEP